MDHFESGRGNRGMMGCISGDEKRLDGWVGDQTPHC